MRGFFNGLAAHGDGPRDLVRVVRLPVDQVGEASPHVEQAGVFFGRAVSLSRDSRGVSR